MALGKLFLIVLFMLSLSVSSSESQANESVLFLTDFQSISPSPTPQQQDGTNSSPAMELFLLPITSLINQHPPTTSHFMLQSSNIPTSLSSSRLAGLSLSILPTKSFILLSTSISFQTKTASVSSEMVRVSASLPFSEPSSTPVFITPSTSDIMTSSLPRVAPSTMFIFSSVDPSTSQSFNIFSTATVDVLPTSSSDDINSMSSIVITSSDLAVSRTSVRVKTESSVVRSTTMDVVAVSSTLLSPTVVISTSPPITMETMRVTVLQTTNVDETTATKEEEDLITRSMSGAGISTPAVIGMVVAACLVLIATALLILVLCYCFCRSRKYEYRTGNEYRVTVQKWNAHYTHYTANQLGSDSVSSSRGSSIMSSFGFRPSSNGRRCGGMSSSTDHIHTGATAEMYSTPL